MYVKGNGPFAFYVQRVLTFFYICVKLYSASNNHQLRRETMIDFEAMVQQAVSPSAGPVEKVTDLLDGVCTAFAALIGSPEIRLRSTPFVEGEDKSGNLEEHTLVAGIVLDHPSEEDLEAFTDAIHDTISDQYRIAEEPDAIGGCACSATFTVRHGTLKDEHFLVQVYVELLPLIEDEVPEIQCLLESVSL